MSDERPKRKFLALARRCGIAVAAMSVFVLFLWTTGAIYYLIFVPPFLRPVLALAYLAGGAYLIIRVENPLPRLSIVAASVLVVYLVTLFQRPSNDRDWEQSQMLTTSVELADGRVTIHGFRHCLYRTETDLDARYEDFGFDLEDLQSVWFLVHRFSPIEGLAHTFLSFEVDSETGPVYFSVSIEVRREAGEVYSPIRGLYRQFELLYVIGDERDVIGVRTVMRKQDRVHMYRVNATPGQVQRLFVDIAGRINKLEQEPEFYHTFLNNCTNGIVSHTYALTPEPINWLDPRIVLPGFSDRFAFANKLIGEDGQTFWQLQARSRIDGRARRIGLSVDFSTKLRHRDESSEK